MKVHLIKEQTIFDYIKDYANSKKGFAEWLSKIKIADWEIPDDIECTFPSADILGNGTSRVVFDIGGNKFRMICSYLYGEKEVHLFVNWIGTHAQYTKLCKKEEQYTVSIYFILWKQH